MPQYKKVFDVGTYAGGSGYTRVGIPTLRTPGAGGKQVAKSLRFRAANSAYLRRTFSLGNRQTWTWSAWVKRGTLGSSGVLFESFGPGGFGVDGIISFNSANILDFIFDYNGGSRWQLTTTQVFRDPSAWYHIVVVADTTNATSGDRLRIYVNGSRVTVFSTANYPSSGANGTLNQAYAHGLGADTTPATYFDGYMSEVYFIDGSALDPTSFGEYNSDNIWVPKAYSGSFAGTNSFYLDFSDVGTTTAGGANTGYGKDLSGKGTPNNWTTNNFGTTSTLATYDSMYDSPTDYDNSVYGAGNYATFNPLVDWHTNGSNFTFASGNLDISEPAATTYGSVASTIAMTTGKWYCEITPTTVGAAQNTFAGITLTTSAAGYPGQSSTSYSYGATGNKFNNNASSAYGATFAANDIIGVAFDADAGSLTFYKNGQSQLTAFTSIPAGSYYFVVGDFATTQSSAFSGNFGQRPFRGEYVSGSGSSFTGTGAPPTGFKALNTKNITRPTDANMWFYGDTPDLMWIKNRTASSTDHSLTDTVRGVGLGLTTNTTPAVENGAQDVAEMNKFGMTLIGASSRTTAASNNFVYWAWKGGGTSSSNTDGFVTSTVSANVAAGFSIATYTGNGSNSSVGHGLGAAPSMIIVKSRSAATNWTVYHSSVGTGKYLSLNTSANTTTDANFFTSATSTLFSMTGSATSINTNAATYVAYCFAPIAGYSAFGIYTANASPTDGPFCYTGFLPRFVMIKATTNISGNWVIIDTARLTYNQNGTALYPNSSNSEITTAYIDFLSNGFKIRNSSTNMNNTSSDTYIYAAFAEHPFKIARAR